MIRKIKQKGSSLVEVMVSIVVFSAVAIALGVILNLGLKSWKDVDGKTEAERELNRAVLDINNTIRNSSVAIGTLPGIKCFLGTSANPRGYILCPSYARYNTLNTQGDSSSHRVIENELDFSISSSTDSSNNVLISAIPNPNFKVVYFIHRDSTCSKCLDLFGSGASDICPHQTLIKKWFKTKDEITINIPKWKEGDNWDNNPSKDIGKGAYKNPYDKILAHNVLAFAARGNGTTVEAGPSYDGGPYYTISYYIKIFKPNLNKAKATQTDLSGSIEAFYDQINHGESATKADPIKDYCLEVHSTVAPLN